MPIRPISTNGVTQLVQDLWELEHHQTAIFPDNTNLTCLLTAAGANAWGGWLEIQDSGATTLSSKFATSLGHIVSAVVESVSDIDSVYMLEVAYGAVDKTIISRWRFAGETKFKNPAHQLRVRAVHVPAGEKIYYRMKSATAGPDTALVHFRYFLHD